MSASTRLSAPADVRAWAIEQGMTVGTRGVLAPQVIKAFNKAHKSAPYRTSEFKPTVVVKATKIGSNGRKVAVRKNVNVADARAAAIAAGVPVNGRGRLPAAILTAYAADDLKSLASAG